MNKSHKPSDQLLLSLLKSDPRAGFERMFHAYYNEVCQHIYRYVPNQAKVEDIAQELFIELWNKRATLLISSAPGAFLRKMAVSRSLNYIRDNRKHAYQDDTDLETSHAEHAGAEQLLYASDLEREISRAIDGLPTKCREVFMLSRFEDYSNRQIADNLGISMKTVENQMTKALRMLKHHLTSFRQE